MDYYKYIKYKTKYVNLKYDNNQYGGGIVPCDKGYKNALGTCWAVAQQTILSSGHLTSDPLNEIMKSFHTGDGSVTTIKGNMELFIEEQIKKVQSNTELTNAFAHYKIFEANKIDFLKDILRTFIERYYNKFINIPFTSKPPIIDLENPETKKKRCEYRMAEDFQNLFDFSHIKKRDENSEHIYGQYLFCNLLSIFLLDYKVSFTKYYDNFNKIEFDDENDLGILIHINGHVCCLFICNGEEKFYNDNDKQIYNCKWKDLLLQGTAGKQLYIIKGCLKFIDDIKTYDGDIKKISKVLSLTFISKHTKEDTTLDKDIKRLLEFKKLDEIKDRNIQFLLAEYYNRIGNFAEARKLYGLSANQGYYISQHNLGIILYNGDNHVIDLDLAREYFKLAADQGFAVAQYMLGRMLYKGEGGSKDYNLAREYFKLAADQGFANAQYMLGMMLYKGEGGSKDYNLAREYVKLAADQGYTVAMNLKFELDLLSVDYTRLDNDNVFRLADELYKSGNYPEAKLRFTYAAYKGHTKSQYMLGLMLYDGEGGEKDKDMARTMCQLAADQDHADAQYMLGSMLYYGEGGKKDEVQGKIMIGKAAMQGNIKAKSLLLLILDRDTEFRLADELYKTRNYPDAKIKFLYAAYKGHTKSQYMLGWMFYNGEGGEKNYEQAKKWFESAADQDHDEAQYMLGRMLYYGEGGEKNYEQAKKWFESAVDKGNVDAMYMLGTMLYYGEGGEKNDDQVKKLFESVADKDNTAAMFMLG